MNPPTSKDVYVCKKCGYVLPKKDAVISGWDAEHSSTHVHCPRCGRVIAIYVKLEKERSHANLVTSP